MQLIIKTNNPYDWNTIIAKRMEKKKDILTPSLGQTLFDKDFVLVGKFLGLETKADFYKYQDKLRDIITWATDRIGSHDTRDIINILKEKLNSCPSMNPKRIDDLWIGCKIEMLSKEQQDHNGNYQRKTEEVES